MQPSNDSSGEERNKLSANVDYIDFVHLKRQSGDYVLSGQIVTPTDLS